MTNEKMLQQEEENWLMWWEETHQDNPEDDTLAYSWKDDYQ